MDRIFSNWKDCVILENVCMCMSVLCLCVCVFVFVCVFVYVCEFLCLFHCSILHVFSILYVLMFFWKKCLKIRIRFKLFINYFQVVSHMCLSGEGPLKKSLWRICVLQSWQEEVIIYKNNRIYLWKEKKISNLCIFAWKQYFLQDKNK